VFGSDFLYFSLQGRCDFARHFIGDNGNPLVRLQSQADADGVARTRRQFGIERLYR
jgi:hypothetical protein